LDARLHCARTAFVFFVFSAFRGVKVATVSKQRRDRAILKHGGLEAFAFIFMFNSDGCANRT
jgi:hypothetical protein